jgi:hypothetical protein
MPAVILLLVAAQLSMMAWALTDLRNPEREVLGGSKRFWALVVLFGNVIGPLAYLLVGRTFRPTLK